MELRLDYFSDPESLTMEIFREYRERLIITVRDVKEGGVRDVNPETKIRLLRSAIQNGFLVDIEISNLGSIPLDYGDQILSRHYLHEDPTYEELESLVREYGGKCRFLKIALRKSEVSSRHLISLLNRYRNLAVMETDGTPASRIVYSLLGSGLIYCHAGEKTSPGQISCRDVVKIFGLIEKLE